MEGVELRGIERARPTEAVLAAIAEAEAIVIGPSNPVISIGPILAVPGMREALAEARRAGGGGEPVRGRARRQGPHRVVLRAGRHRAERRRDRGRPTTGVLDGIVADEDVTGLPVAHGSTR